MTINGEVRNARSRPHGLVNRHLLKLHSEIPHWSPHHTMVATIFTSSPPREGDIGLDGLFSAATGIPSLIQDSQFNTSQNESTGEHQVRDTDACILFKFIMYTIAMGILCILGFAGNTVSFLVLRKDLSTPVASFLLEVLAIADNVLLMLWIIHYSIRESFRFFGLASNFHYAWMYIRVYTFPVMYMAQTATIWLTVVIALNRYMAVCLPYKAPHLCNINNVYKGVAVVILFSIFYNLPRLFEIQIVLEKAGNTTEAAWRRTALGSNQIYNVVYVDAFYYMFSFVLPLLTLAFVNTRVTIAYQAIRQRKRRMTSRRQENENNITLVMIIIVLIFMLCQAPARIVQLVWGYKYKHCETYQFYLIHISNTLEVLNSSINFVVYFMFRKRFRDIALSNYCFGALSSRHRQSPDRTVTTEGLSLVQIEQTTAMVMQDVRRDSSSNKLQKVSGQPEEKVNGNCPPEHMANNMAAGSDDVANGVADPCLQNSDDPADDNMDTPDVPLRP